MYNTPKQSNTNTHLRYDQKKPPYNQQSRNSNYRKQNRYEDDYEDNKEPHYKEKNPNQYNKKTQNQSHYQSGESINSSNKKVNLARNYHTNQTCFFIEYKGKEIELGSRWKDVMSAIDNHFDKNDMELNLAVKINVWKELKDNQNIIVGKDEIKDILTAYGKYRDKNN